MPKPDKPIFLDYPFKLPPLPPGLDYLHTMNHERCVWVRRSSVISHNSGGISRAVWRTERGCAEIRASKKAGSQLSRDWHTLSAHYLTFEDAVHAMVTMLWLGEIHWRD